MRALSACIAHRARRYGDAVRCGARGLRDVARTRGVGLVARLAMAAMVAVIGSAAAASRGDDETKSATSPRDAKALPYTMRPGDVIVNAPLGVLRPVVRTRTAVLIAPALGVTRTQPATQRSVPVYGTPLGVLRGGGVLDVEPDRLSRGGAAQIITVQGTGLGVATSLAIEPGDGVTVSPMTVAGDGASLTAEVTVAAAAPPGVRRVVLRDATGRVLPELVLHAGEIMIEADMPVIDSIAPSLVARGNTYELVIRGRNLRGIPVRGAQPAFDEQPSVRITPDTGLVVSSTPQSNDAGTLVTVGVEVGGDAPLVDRVVQIVTESGNSVATATPANTLRVAGSALTVRSPYLSPVLGVRVGTPASPPRLAYSAPIGVLRGAGVIGMTPTFVTPGTRARLTLTGNALADATAIELTPAAGITVDAATFTASDGSVAVDLDVAPDAALVARRVTLVRTAGRLDAPRVLEVRGAAPEVHALTPTFLPRDGVTRDIAIQGRHFGQATGGFVAPPAGLVVESFTVESDTRARLRVRAETTAATGPRVVRVAGLNETSTEVADPANTLYIIDARQARGPTLSPLLGVRVETAAPPAPSRTYRSSLVGVVRGAHAVSVSPDRINRGGVTRLTVAGRALDGVSGVAIVEDDLLIVRNVVVAPDGNSVSFDVEAGADAAPGTRRVALTAGGAPVPFLPPRAAFVQVADNVAAAPVANPDAYDVRTNVPLVIAADDGVLENDTDPLGQPMYAVLRRLPTSGTVNLGSDGSFVYTPSADFSGVDRFDYAAGSDARVGIATTVTLTVRELDDAVADAYSVADNQVLTVPAALGLFANDVLAAGAPPSIELVSQPTLGALVLAPDGSFTYTPNGPAGVDRFRYRLVRDGTRSAPAEVAITVNAVEESPIAVDDQYAVDRGRVLTVNAPGVMANDRDPDGGALTVRVLSDPDRGTLVLSANGAFSYTPPVDFVGATTFTYELSDPTQRKAQAVVTINVNDNLAPAPDAYAFDEGEVLFVDAPGVLANDSVIVRGTLRVIVTDPPTFGTVQMANDGSFVYRPDTPDRSGLAIFRYRLQDDVVSSAPVDVRITVRPINDPPVAKDDRYLSDENAELLVPANLGLLANDVDVEAASLTASVLVPPAHGVVQIRPDGSFTYIPEVNWRGTDTFGYRVTDAGGASSTATASIDVTQPPTATNDVYLVDVDTALVVNTPLTGLLANDHDAPERDVLTGILGELPEHGVLTFTPNGYFTYVPDTGYSGIDTFTYQVTDGRSESNVATVTLAVGITSLPRALPDEYETTEDGELVVPVLDGVLANDTDADTPRANLEAYLVGADWNGSTLDVTLARDGSFRVRPWGNYFGETYFIYQVYDGTDISNAAVVKITVHPVNDGVDAVDDRYGVQRNTVRTGELARNDTWDRDFVVGFAVEAAPANGTVVINPNNGFFTYTPARDFSGSDTFTYRLTQLETGDYDIATVTLRTNGVPTLMPDAYTVAEDSSTVVTPSLLANDSDPDGDPLVLAWTYFTDSVYVTARVDRVNPPHVTTIDTANHFYGERIIWYTATDGTANASEEITVTVLPSPDAPIANGEEFLTQQNTTLVVAADRAILRNDHDPDQRPSPSSPPWPAASGVDLLPLTLELVSNVEHGTLTLATGGTFTYVPARDHSGFDRFTYRLRDGTNRTSSVVETRIRINSPAVAFDDVYVATEDVPLVVPANEGLLLNDTDRDNDPLRAGGAGSGCAPCNGQVVIREDGGFRYVPNTNFHGTDEFFYAVRDGVNGSDVGRVAITVLPVNDAPVPEDDTYRTREDVVLTAAEPQGLLRNDREVDGENLNDATVITAPTHGDLTLAEDGAFTYTPQPNFNGRDTYVYRIFDDTGLHADALVEVLVTAVNDDPLAVDDAYETLQDAELRVVAGDGVLKNDGDIDGPSLTVALVDTPDHGYVALAPDGSFVYRPNGTYAGVDSFQYQLDDGLGAVDAATVAIRVLPVAPTVSISVQDDFYRFTGPTHVQAAPGVLANDSVTGTAAPLTATLVAPPEVGTVALAPDGSFTYTAPPDFSGVAGFTYAANAEGSSELARVTLDVAAAANVPPVANGERYSVLEDRVLDTASAGSALVNDTDFERAPLTMEVLATTTHGALGANADGHFTYTPLPDYAGEDSFRYRVSDGQQWSGEVTATITVFAQNDAPLARADALRAVRDVPLVVAAPGVLANDADVDGDPLAVELVDVPLYGSVDAAANGALTYTPAPAFLGTDRFRYAASDGLARAVAEVTVVIGSTVNLPPSANGETYTLDEDTEQQGDLLANDVDPDGDALAVAITTEPAHGTLALDGGRFTYRPHANWHGSDAFAYTVSDGGAPVGPVTAALTVRAVNDAPDARTDQHVVAQGAVLSVSADAGVLRNDGDVDGDALTVTLESEPAHGTLTLQPTGAFAYRAVAGFVGRDEFAYRANDGTTHTVGRVVIDVTAVANQRPIAIGEVFSLAEDTVFDSSLLDSLLANDRDPEGLPLALEVTSAPAAGVLDVLAGGHVRYTPVRDATGEVVIGYVAHDGTLASDPVQARLVLLPVDDAPQAETDVYSTGGVVDFVRDRAHGVLANDRDVDGDALIATLVAAPQFGTATLALDGSFRYRATGTPRDDRFTYRAADPSGRTSEATVELRAGDPPVGTDDVIYRNGFESP